MLLERLGWTYVPRDALTAERGGEREVSAEGAAAGSALLRLNEWMTEAQADRVIFDLEHIDATGMGLGARPVHEYLTYGMPIDRGRTAGKRFPHRPLLRLRPS